MDVASRAVLNFRTCNRFCLEPRALCDVEFCNNGTGINWQNLECMNRQPNSVKEASKSVLPKYVVKIEARDQRGTRHSG